MTKPGQFTRPGARRSQRIDGPFAHRQIEMLESPAYRVLSLSAHRVLSRIEIELWQHGAKHNGSIHVSFDEFEHYGMHRRTIAPAIRELEALGFIRVKQGHAGNAEHRSPNLFCLTWIDEAGEPMSKTHRWKRIKSMADAERVQAAARNAKPDSSWRVSKTFSSGRKHTAPVAESATKNTKSLVAETATIHGGRNCHYISDLHGEGGREAVAAASRGRGHNVPLRIRRRHEHE